MGFRLTYLTEEEQTVMLQLPSAGALGALKALAAELRAPATFRAKAPLISNSLDDMRIMPNFDKFG